MNYLHLLTLVFVLAKAFDKIDWSWWLVFAPSIASFVLFIAFILFLASFSKN